MAMTASRCPMRCLKWAVLILLSSFALCVLISRMYAWNATRWTRPVKIAVLQEAVPQENVAVVPSKPASNSTPAPPVQHVFYLKTHKTGSTTMYSILAEYCRSHRLLPLLPSGVHITLHPPFSPRMLMLSPKIAKHDMVFSHFVFTPAIFKYLHNDTMKFTTLREPFSHFVSSFGFFSSMGGGMPYLKRIPGPVPIYTLLANPAKHEGKKYESYTNNRQSLDLGFNPEKRFDDQTYIQEFIQQTDKTFDLVLITEFFSESLILLKRTLRWSMEDMLYYKKNVRTEKMKGHTVLNETHREQHRKFSQADIALYSHFLPIFQRRVEEQGEDFKEEVKEFDAVLRQVHSFCDTAQTNHSVKITAGRFHDEFSLTDAKCKWLKLDEVSYTHYLQKSQRERVKTMRL